MKMEIIFLDIYKDFVLSIISNYIYDCTFIYTYLYIYIDKI